MKIKYLFLGLVLSVLVYSCSKDDDKVVDPALSTSVEDLAVDQSGTDGTFAVTSNNNWSATSDADWLTVEPADGNSGNNQNVSVKAEANEGLAERTATITVVSGELTKTLTVTQAGVLNGNWNIEDLSFKGDASVKLSEDGDPIAANFDLALIDTSATTGTQLTFDNGGKVSTNIDSLFFNTTASVEILQDPLHLKMNATHFFDNGIWETNESEGNKTLTINGDVYTTTVVDANTINLTFEKLPADVVFEVMDFDLGGFDLGSVLGSADISSSAIVLKRAE